MSEDRQERFAAYVEALAEVIGHADRAAPLRDYCLGLLLPGERKSVEPIAAVTAPARVSAKHQSLLHFVTLLHGSAGWRRELGDVGGRPLPGYSDPRRAVQSQSGVSPPHSQAAAPGNQLG